MEQIAPTTEASIPQISCPFCNSKIDSMAFFCPVCGKKVRETPVSNGIGGQLVLYLMAIFLPPFNFPLTMRYLRSSDQMSKKIGWISLIIMIISLVVISWSTFVFVRSISSQVDQQLNIYQKMGY